MATAPPRTVAGLLEALPGRFQPDLLRGLAAVNTTRQLCQALRELVAEGGPECYGADAARLRELLVPAAVALSSAAVTLEAMAASLPAGISPALVCGSTAADAGMAALYAIARLAQQLEVAEHDAFRIAAACSLVFGAARSLLVALSAANITALEAIGLPAQYAVQTSVVSQTMQLLQRWPAVAAAFAGSTARPAVVLPWLQALLRARSKYYSMEAVHRVASSAMFDADCGLCEVLLHHVLSSPAYAKHQEAIAADSELQQSLASCLLDCAQHAAAWLMAEALRGELPPPDEPGASLALMCVLEPLLRHPALAPALHQRMQAGGGAAAVQLWYSTVQELPGARPDCIPPALYCQVYALVAGMISSLCSSMLPPQPPQPEGQLPERVQPAVAAAAEAEGQPDADSAAESAVATNRQEQHEAAWTVARLLPQLAVVVWQCANELGAAAPAEGSSAAAGEASAGATAGSSTAAAALGSGSPAAAPAAASLWTHLATLCGRLAEALGFVQELAGVQGTPSQYSRWITACEAALRLQPVLAQLDPALRQLEQPQLRSAVAQLARQAANLLVCQPEVLPPAGMAAEEHEMHAVLGDQFWLVHTLLARLVHWLAGGGRLADAPTLSAADWSWLQYAADTVLLRGVQRLEPQFDNPMHLGGSFTETWALCAAHLELTSVITAAAGAAGAADSEAAGTSAGGSQNGDIGGEADGSAAGGGRDETDGSGSTGSSGSRQEIIRLLQHVRALLVAARFNPLLVANGPGLVAELQSALARFAPGSAAASKALHVVVDAGKTNPWLVTAVAETPLLGAAVDTAMAGSRGAALEMLFSLAFSTGQLAAAASVALDNAAATGMPASLAADLKAAVRQLRQQREDALGQLMQCEDHTRLEPQLRQLVQSAGAVGQLLRQDQARPERAKPRDVELANKVAVRACAYLRCANVEGEGGPAAGQGIDCKRCSACRAVWYCGTACSHADWRAGHKRVCKALAAERQAARVARAAAEQH